MNEVLISAVIEQIKQDVADEDYMALAEMLSLVPEHILKGFLPEVDRLG